MLEINSVMRYVLGEFKPRSNNNNRRKMQGRPVMRYKHINREFERMRKADINENRYI